MNSGQNHTRFPEGAHPAPWYPSNDTSYTPGLTAQNAGGEALARRSQSGNKEKIADWFERPLRAFCNEDSIVTLMVCLPLIEKYVKFQVREGGRGDGGGFDSPVPENNPLLTELRKFLGVPTNSDALYFYSTIRNGLLHRAMPNKPETEGRDFRLHPERSGHEPVEVGETPTGIRRMTIYVWILRDRVCSEILSAKTKMWTRDNTPLLDIFEIT